MQNIVHAHSRQQQPLRRLSRSRSLRQGQSVVEGRQVLLDCSIVYVTGQKGTARRRLAVILGQMLHERDPYRSTLTPSSPRDDGLMSCHSSRSLLDVDTGMKSMLLRGIIRFVLTDSPNA